MEEASREELADIWRGFEPAPETDREELADWPRIYEDVQGATSRLDDEYELGLGGYWLAGLNRWEEPPGPFGAGQWYLGEQ